MDMHTSSVLKKNNIQRCFLNTERGWPRCKIRHKADIFNLFYFFRLNGRVEGRVSLGRIGKRCLYSPRRCALGRCNCDI